MYGAGINQTQAAMGLYGNPLMTQLNAVSPTSLLGTAGQMSQGLGTKIFQPESQYNAALQSANQGVQTQIAAANAQAQAGWASGLMGMAGSLGGALLKNPNFIGGRETGGGLSPINLTNSFQGTDSLNLGNYTLGGGAGGIGTMSGGGFRIP
jgi:hypothetical protein